MVKMNYKPDNRAEFSASDTCGNPGLSVAIIGATGLVGRKITALLQSRRFPVNKIRLFAGSRSSGRTIRFRGKPVKVERLTPECAAYRTDIAIFSAGAEISDFYAPLFASNGTVVIDNSSRWRKDPLVPLIVPEVNSEKLIYPKNIIANPNCSTIQAAVVLAPLHKLFGIERIIFTTLQSVSGAGRAGCKQLGSRDRSTTRVFPLPIHSNVIPQIGEFDDDGYSEEENKLISETKKILCDNRIRITATAVRVPVFLCHSESVNIRFASPVTAGEIYAALAGLRGITVCDEANKYPTPLTVKGSDDVFVGRIRRDFSCENCFNFWIVADNLRKGAATNAVQIAEIVAARLLTSRLEKT